MYLWILAARHVIPALPYLLSFAADAVRQGLDMDYVYRVLHRKA